MAAKVIKEVSPEIQKLREMDNRKVKGRFSCLEPLGGSVTFPFKKYRGDPVVHYTFEDGQEYEIPLAVAKHLNSCGWDVHSHVLDANGKPTINVGKKHKRFIFQSMDYAV